MPRMKIRLGIPAALLLLACETKKDAPVVRADPITPVPATPTAAVAVVPSASAVTVPPEVPAPQACKLMDQKVWGKGVNALAGLTVRELVDGRAAIGFAFGSTPKVLVVDRKGRSTLHTVALKPGTPLATPPKPKEASREVMRVTPRVVNRQVAEAYVDFRDIYVDGRRHVACGDADHEWLTFEGRTLVGKDNKAPAKPDASLFKAGKYSELRDCRTIVDGQKASDAWLVGSLLVASQAADGVTAYKSQLIVADADDKSEHVVHTIDLKAPAKGDVSVAGYEVPVAAHLGDEHLLAVRQGSRLLVGLLDLGKQLKGSFKSYEGYPSLVDIGADGPDIVLSTSVAKGKGAFGLRQMRLDHDRPEFPSAMRELALAENVDENDSDAEFVRGATGQRWYSFIDGERGKGTLFIVPVNSKLVPSGKAYAVTEGAERAREGRLVALRDGGLVVVYTRQVDGAGDELVTEDLDCEVVK
jgi:hypothetical protein